MLARRSRTKGTSDEAVPSPSVTLVESVMSPNGERLRSGSGCRWVLGEGEREGSGEEAWAERERRRDAETEEARREELRSDEDTCVMSLHL